MAFDSVADGYLNSPTIAACFDARATVAAMLEFEAALAAAEAGLGVIPQAAASVIAECCKVEHIDIERLKHDTAQSSSAAIPLVDQLTALVAARDADAALYVHWGSSTQDVMDSALMLQVRAALAPLHATLERACASLAGLAAEHRATPIAARTLSQHALPTTFGYKAALWLDGLLNARAELERHGSALRVQFGGAAGTLASFGDAGIAVRDAVAAKLRLAPALPWHTERSVVRLLGVAVANTAAAAGKIAHDLILLQQTEIAEVTEGGAPGRGGSSALPHKRNPVATVAVTAGARRVPGLLSTLFASYDHANERATGAWHAEWSTLREIFVVTGGMLEQLVLALEGLDVRSDAMARNLGVTEGAIMSEAVAMALAPSLGRSAAQALVKRALAETARDGDPFAHVLGRNESVVRHLGVAGLARALEPSNYLGAVEAMIDTVLDRYQSSCNVSESR